MFRTVLTLTLVAGLALGLGGVGTAWADSMGRLDVRLDFTNESGAPLGSSFGMGTAEFGPLGTDGSFDAMVQYQGTGIADILPPYMVKGGGPVKPSDVSQTRYAGEYDLTLAVTDPTGKQSLPINQIFPDGTIGPTGVVRHRLFLAAPLLPGQVQVPGATVGLIGTSLFQTPIGRLVLVAHPGGGSSIPEPVTLLLLGTGLTGLGALAWRRRRSG